MIRLSSLISESVDGRGYLTKEKFGSIVLAELQKVFPGFATIELTFMYDGQEFKHNKRRGMRHNRDNKSLSDRNSIYNSVLMGVYSVEYNDNEYEVRIVNTFKKVPDGELSNKFTMADDEYLKRMPFKSLEPKDLNKSNNLMKWQCKVSRVDDDKVLIPKNPGYAILFDDYKTLKEVVDDVKKVIDKDSGFGGGSSKTPGAPVVPNLQIAEATLEQDENPSTEVTQFVNSILKDIKQLQYDLGFTKGIKIIYVIDEMALARYVKITQDNLPVFTMSAATLQSHSKYVDHTLEHEVERVLVHELGHAYLDLMEVDSLDRNVLADEELVVEDFAQSFMVDRNIQKAKQILDTFVEEFEFEHGLNENTECPRCKGWKYIWIRPGIPNVVAACPVCGGEKHKTIRIYRGVSEVNKKYDNFYTTDKEWARQFTQSGLDREVKTARINTADIYKPMSGELARACNQKHFDQWLEDATKGGFKAMWVNEGQNEPPSIYIIDKTALL